MCIETMGRFSDFYFAVCSWRWGVLSQQVPAGVLGISRCCFEGGAGLHILTLQVSCGRAVGQAAVEQMCAEALSMVSTSLSCGFWLTW